MIYKIVKHWKMYEVMRTNKLKMITQKPTKAMKDFMENAEVTTIGSKTIYTVRR